MCIGASDTECTVCHGGFVQYVDDNMCVDPIYQTEVINMTMSLIDRRDPLNYIIEFSKDDM